MEAFRQLSPVLQALCGTLFTWFLTALGAGAVFLTGEIKQKVLDLMLAFAAGAMIFVVAEDLIPESQNNANTHAATFGVLLGFTVMMVLDVALG